MEHKKWHMTNIDASTSTTLRRNNFQYGKYLTKCKETYVTEDGCLLGCSAAASTSETSVNFYQTTQRYNPEDSHLRTRRRENLETCMTLAWYVICSAITFE
jgi:hypothetical protein